MYAMYVIGQVESHHNWAAVNMSDPITLGMMQWYGGRAYNLLVKCKNADPAGWTAFKAQAPGLAAHVEANNVVWNGYYIDGVGAQAWRNWATRKENHEAQQAQWEEDYNNYNRICDQQGFPAGNVKQRILFMTAWHQGPKYALEAVRTCGPGATLAAMRQAILNNYVLGRYPNRYNTAYNMLNSWNGTSEPPNFGQSGGGGGGGAPVPPPHAGGDPGAASTVHTQSVHRWIHAQSHSTLALHEGGKVTLFYLSSADNYTGDYIKGASTSTDQSHPGGGGGTPPPPPPQPGGGGGSQRDKRIDKVLAWEAAHAGKLAYSQGAGRLNSDRSGYGDCSSTIWQAYKTIGVDVGTWTGAMVGRGRLIAAGHRGGGAAGAVAKAEAGDLLLLCWGGGNPMMDHVCIFMRDKNFVWSHGGPGRGPVKMRAIADEMAIAADWQIRRYI